MFFFSDEEAAVLEGVCEAVVPGSAPVGPVTYIDSVALELPPPLQEAVRGAIAELAPALREQRLDEAQFGPGFQLLRALAIEAYYSDFAEPGYDGPTAWDAIDFSSSQARRLRKDWSFLRCSA